MVKPTHLKRWLESQQAMELVLQRPWLSLNCMLAAWIQYPVIGTLGFLGGSLTKAELVRPGNRVFFLLETTHTVP